MHILKVGFNYKTTPVEIREKFTFNEEKLSEAMIVLKEQKSILENVIVSTCNRTEVYAVVDQLHTGRYYIKQFLADWFGEEKETFSTYLHITEDDGAMEHLFRVTTGLDSMVLGETQILGQLKQAFSKGQLANTTGTIFNELFKQAITFGKRMHKETGIGEHAVSISYAAVELAKEKFGDLSNKHVAILGAGKMGELAAKNIQGAGVKDITVINRTQEKAKMMAEKFEAKVAGMDELSVVLEEADILISSTGSESVVLSKEDIEKVQSKRQDKELFLVDIAVPRDIDPEIAEVNQVALFDIDHLQNIVDEHLESRKAAAEQIEISLEEEIVQFKEWMKTLGVIPVISALRQKALSIQSETMQSIERKIPSLTDREKKVLNKHTKSIINQLLKEPITQAKELAGAEQADEALQLFIDIFGIENEVREEFAKQLKKNDAFTKFTQEEASSFKVIERVTTA
ncbi:glutamyl-tRNA reductase [Oceanobacillus oncorhynchi subsp. incaldanensis]|uniref:Glutamyl-tRNA reductase n=1 Tax=Oceanobacillus oncorhynchi TaxID=545501 RepID=A0A0A1MWY0_9BACI|nr:glutamyl-tRNA reductase [Oceanobacillus oncorhynchi]UUI38246.1 glutamyl-tRNA reductase [Oceanobacillus oncorhynchi]GIO17034.1 glutamyl-tRNA reductase [Oceanobacillus oncorhynchi subsp. incaldanensis]CEI83912.1 Glutamyl-tRNA reductase [Oceanobacillus oncorhynchi]